MKLNEDKVYTNIEELVAVFMWFLFWLYMVFMFKLSERRNRLIGQKEDLEECQPDMFKDWDRFN